ncbi:hypothetical protein [Demequina mangrovi]|uniref:Uncharacterized protein n=1 Tax=Demequina mangrovi TaxID=1043493 RepID=A0A1H6XLY6_9MICO|nr:hypothetical protein [Demequina mangrovi]SEJ25902.1 hypothetical protein SAMN05421637_1357 [Demequina mangrovi]
MTTPTIYLCAADGPDASLADAFESALPRAAGRRRVRVVRAGDPAARDWFLLLASPEAAASEAVERAIVARTTAVGVARFQVVVTAGTWDWDVSRGSLDAASTAVPRALVTAFRTPPRHLDYGADRTRHVSLRNAVFAEQVAEIVAPAIGVAKDQIFGEEVRARRRTRWLTRATASLLAVLGLAAGAGAVLATAAAAEAERERDRAVLERAASESRRLAALADQVRSEDGALATLLAIEAGRAAETEQAAAALAAAQVADSSVVRTERATAETRRLLGHDSGVADIDAGLAHVATVDWRGVVRIWPLAEAGSPVEVDTEGAAYAIAWAHDGETLGALVGGELRTFDATGMPLDTVAVEPGALTLASWGPTGFVAAGQSVTLASDGEVSASGLPERMLPGDTILFAQGSADGASVVFGTGQSQVVAVDGSLEVLSSWKYEVSRTGYLATMEVPITVLASDGATRVILPPDNVRVVMSHPATSAAGESTGPIAAVVDVQTGQVVEELVGDGYFPLPAGAAGLLPDGKAVALSTGGLEAGASLAVSGFDLDLASVPFPESMRMLELSDDGTWLVLAGGDDEAYMVSTGVVPASVDEQPDAAVAGADQACGVAGRNMTEGEWRLYMLDEPYRATCDAYAAPHIEADAEAAQT